LSLIFFNIRWITQVERILTEEKGVVKEKYNPLWREGGRTTTYGGERGNMGWQRGS
jgi:hypothetical protein